VVAVAVNWTPPNSKNSVSVSVSVKELYTNSLRFLLNTNTYTSTYT